MYHAIYPPPPFGKRMERLAKTRLSSISELCHITPIYTVNAPILYIYIYLYMYMIDFLRHELINFVGQQGEIKPYSGSRIFSKTVQRLPAYFHNVNLNCFVVTLTGIPLDVSVVKIVDSDQTGSCTSTYLQSLLRCCDVRVATVLGRLMCVYIYVRKRGDLSRRKSNYA